MTELLTSAQMRAIEKAAIASGKVTGLELMEAAGHGVVDAVFAEWPEFAPDEAPADTGSPDNPVVEAGSDKRNGALRAVVLCGPGNNGGDGFVVARLLAGLGWTVDVFLYGDPEKLPPDARANYQRWREIGAVRPLTADCLSACEKPELLVDALFGTGLARPLPEAVRGVFHWLLHFSPDWKASDRKRARRVRMRSVSVDIASGLSADTGNPVVDPEEDPDDARESDSAWPYFMTTSFHPDLTVTFHTPKVGHYLGLGAGAGSPVRVVPLPGLPMPMGYIAAAYGDAATVHLIEPKLSGRRMSAKRMFPELEKRPGHKYDHGHALILSGPAGKGGAARLAARAALRMGAGLVTLGCPHAALAENAAQLNAIMLAEVDDAATLGRLLDDHRLNALALGPGLGTERARDLVPVALEAGRATVLDADALTAFAHDPARLFRKLHDKCVLTPHAGEFARLFPDLSAKLAAPSDPAFSKVDATRAAAKRAGCTILFKGADTVIADLTGRATINAAAYDRAVPWLATAGAGDVLTGMIAGLLARDFEPQKAAEAAAWLHVEAALSFGPGLIAEDLPEALPTVFKSLDL